MCWRPGGLKDVQDLAFVVCPVEKVHDCCCCRAAHFSTPRHRQAGPVMASQKLASPEPGYRLPHLVLLPAFRIPNLSESFPTLSFFLLTQLNKLHLTSLLVGPYSEPTPPQTHPLTPQQTLEQQPCPTTLSSMLAPAVSVVWSP